MADEIRKKYPFEVEFIKSGGGVFEIRKDGQLIFSKKTSGRFPETAEILEKLK